MFTPRQQELIEKFFDAVSFLDQAGERQNIQGSNKLLKNYVITAAMKPDQTEHFEPEQVERQHLIFRQLEQYSKCMKLSRRLSFLVVVCAFVFAAYEFYYSGWVWGIASLVLVPIGAIVSYMIFLSFLAPGFSPLLLGLTHTECQFALDEIVGHSRWRQEGQ